MPIPICPHCKKETDTLLLESVNNETGEKKYKVRQVMFPITTREGKPIWKNILHIDWFVVFIVITLLFTSWAYKSDMAKCDQVIKDPVGFCRPNCKAIALIPEVQPDNDQFLQPLNITFKE